MDELSNWDSSTYHNLFQQIEELREKQLATSKLYFEEESRKNQLTASIEQIEKDIETQHLKINQLKQNVDASIKETKEYEVTIACLNFWEKAFERRTRKLDDIAGADPQSNDSEDTVLAPPINKNRVAKNQFITMRSYMLEHSIDDLNQILKEYTALLGENSMAVSFDYDFMIKEEYGKRSAGQRKRNHLVIFFGLFELVRQQSRFLPNFLMLDEVFDAIDKIGQQHIKDVIGMIANQHVSKIFIITHNMTRSADEAIGGLGGEHLIRATMTHKGTKYEIF